MTYAKKKSLLLAAWTFTGLFLPTAGYFFVPPGIPTDLLVITGCLSIVLSYLATLIVMSQHMRDFATHMGLVATVYLISAFCLSIIFSSYAAYFNLYGSAQSGPYKPYLHEDIFDPLYFSVSVFTTLGANDFNPRGFAGKFMTATEALIGTTHSVTFVALLLIRLTRRLEEEERERAA